MSFDDVLNQVLLESLSGEYWIIDGRAEYADGDVGDMNHVSHVIDYVLGQHDLDFETADAMSLDELVEAGLSADEIYVISTSHQLQSNFDPREYAMKELGWHRIESNNVQTHMLNASILDEITNGLFDAFGDDVERYSFNIDVARPGQYYTNVPWEDLIADNPAILRRYLYRPMG